MNGMCIYTLTMNQFVHNIQYALNSTWLLLNKSFTNILQLDKQYNSFQSYLSVVNSELINMPVYGKPTHPLRKLSLINQKL